DEKAQIISELDLQERIIPLSESETSPAANDTADEMLASEIDQADGVELRADTPEPKSNSSDAYSTEADSEAPQATTEDIQVVPADTKQTEQAEVLVDLRVDAINPNPVPTSRSQQTISISGQGFTPNSEVVVSWTGNEKKLSKTQIHYVSENQIDITITVGSSEDDWRVHVVDPEAGKSNTASFRVTQFDQGYQKDKWILTQNPGDFTLQLFGTNKQTNAEEFIQQHRLGDEAGYFYSRDDGKDWYRVIYGAFPDKAAAQQAASSLPASLKVKPWVRRLDDIQASINASRKVTQRNRPKTTTATAVSEPTSFPLAGASSAEYESWLWSQDPAKFTLQLLGARQSDSIKKFLRKYRKLNGKAVYFHTRHNDRDWYTVVYGVYETRKQAQQAIKRLPDELQTASPWIRSFASIHAELDRAD
ncbi:MAG: SPOR domain-containing protein, partial [Thioalkalispiraceae bacterium]